MEDKDVRPIAQREKKIPRRQSEETKPNQKKKYEKEDIRSLEEIKRKNERKKVQRINKKKCEELKKQWEEHLEALDVHEVFKPESMIETPKEYPSYSMMHSFSEGFAIVMYSGSHRLQYEAASIYRRMSCR